MTPERLRELKFQVRRHMNGEVAEIMKGLDDSYAANYGMSVQHARDVARAERLTAAECAELWATGWRDLMLVAAAGMGLLPDAEPEAVAAMAATARTVEMADALPFLIAPRMARTAELVALLQSRDEGNDFAIAAGFAARALMARTAACGGQDAAGRAEWEEAADPDVAQAAVLLKWGEGRGAWTLAEAHALSLLARQCCRLARHGEAFRYCADMAGGRFRDNAAGRADAASRAVADDIDAELEMLGGRK